MPAAVVIGGPALDKIASIYSFPDTDDWDVLGGFYGEAELVKEMADFITQAPRTWLEILKHFHGQPYPVIYRAFGQLRPKLGRMADERPTYPYTFAYGCFVHGKAGLV